MAGARPPRYEAAEVLDLQAVLRILPPEAVRQVADYVEFLQTKYRSVSPVGSPESLLACWGKWQFAPDERAELDAYIQATREMDDDRLSA